MGVMNLWHFRMIHEADKEQQQYYFGIVDDQFQPHPVYLALQSQATQQHVMHRGYHQETHWALQYGGLWRDRKDSRAVLGAYREAVGNSTVRFQFYGTELDLVTSRHPGAGRVLVSIDGVPAIGLPRDSAGRAYLDLTSATEEWQVRLPLATGLADGLHTVELVAEGPLALDGLVVDRRLGFPWVLMWLGITSAALFCAIAVQLARERRDRWNG